MSEKDPVLEQCDYMHLHEKVIEQVLEEMPEEEMCVCDIAQLLNMSQSAISHQLRVLKQAQLVKYRREGKTVFYSLADAHVNTILNQGLEHIEE